MSLITLIVDVLGPSRRRSAATREQTLLRTVAAQRTSKDSDPLASLALVPHLVTAARRGLGVPPLTVEETADMLGLDRELVRVIERDSSHRAGPQADAT